MYIYKRGYISPDASQLEQRTQPTSPATLCRFAAASVPGMVIQEDARGSSPDSRSHTPFGDKNLRISHPDSRWILPRIYETLNLTSRVPCLLSPSSHRPLPSQISFQVRMPSSIEDPIVRNGFAHTFPSTKCRQESGQGKKEKSRSKIKIEKNCFQYIMETKWRERKKQTFNEDEGLINGGWKGDKKK